MSIADTIRLRQLHQLPPEALISREDAAVYLGVSVKTLATWAVQDKRAAIHLPQAGDARPALKFVKFGGFFVKYSKADLDGFVAACNRLPSSVRGDGA